jgi:hypothetical protein
MASAKIAAKVLFGMIVRERRRIAALARTASSLDEKVQEAEAAAAAKDAAFRAYVDEQRIEAADLAQNQQEHILSLMDMVREAPTEGADGDEEMSSPVRSVKARHAERANSKLLLLANERIAVLERQLQELELGREVIQKHREREDEARSLLDGKTKECEELEEELDELRSAIRSIREGVSLHEATTEPFGNKDSKHVSTSQALLDIVVRALHSPTGSSDSKLKRRRRSSASKGHVDSPARTIKRQTEFMHSSDSDEVPDWADDIMMDLATIAEGKMPSSLLESADVVNAEAQLENNSVFDRLTNPDGFTGVQKQKNSRGVRPKKARSAPDQTSEGQRQRKMISRQVADSLDKFVIPGETAQSETGRRSSKDKSSAEKQDAKKRSVFDRLLSPSNLTGTQKQKFHAKQEKRDRSGPLNLEKALDDQPAATDEAQENTIKREPLDEKVAEELLDGLLEEDEGGMSAATQQSITSRAQPAASSSSTRKRGDYKDLNVFERLNKTTTQAYAVKQHVNIAEKMLHDLLDESESQEDEEPPKAEPHFERVEEYAQQNVFERLQKTTTRAYAVKRSSNKAEKLLDDLIDSRERSSSQAEPGSPLKSKAGQQQTIVSPGRPAVSSPEYENVFERLQKTTTEAYAKKKNPPIEHIGHNSGGFSNEASDLRSIAIETGSFSNTTDKLLDDMIDTDAGQEVSSSYDPSSPISKRLRSRRRGEPEIPEQSPYDEKADERLQKTTTEAYAKRKP